MIFFPTDLLIAESHLAAGVAGDVHPAEEEAAVVDATGAHGPSHLALDAPVILLVDNVVHAVAVDQQILLQSTEGKKMKKQLKKPIA